MAPRYREDAPYLNFNLKLLRLTGVWYERGIFCRMSIFTTYMMIMYVVIFLGSIMEIYIFMDDIPIATESLSGLLAYLASFHKLVTLIWYEKDLKYLVHVIKQNFFAYEQREVPEHREILLQREKSVRRLTLYFGVFLFCTGTFVNLLPVAEGEYDQSVTNSTHKWRFPSRIYLPIDTDPAVIYWPLYAFHCTIAWTHSLVMPACDCFFVALMTQAGGQLYILRDNLEHFYENTLKRVQKTGQISIEGSFVSVCFDTGNTEFISIDSTKEEVAAKEALEMRDKRLERELDIELRKYITHHKIILRFVERLEKVINKPMFTQFISSTVIICVSAFQIAAFSDEAVKSLGMAGFFFSELLKLGMYCYYADVVIEQGEMVGYSVYFSKWYISPESIKQTAEVMMARSAKSSLFTVGKCLDLTLQTFSMVLKYSYSYFLLLYELHH